jgi:hypothetical protein
VDNNGDPNKPHSCPTAYLSIRRASPFLTSFLLFSFQVFLMLAMASLLFGLFMMPYRGLILYNLLMPTKYYNMWFFLFARQAVYTSSALKPLVYMACSYQFRKAFKNVVCCRNKQEDNLHLELQATATML